jgi:hypothetical protein
VVQVAAAVEVDEGLEGDLGSDVGFCGGGCDLFAEGVEGGYVGVVVFGVVELHNLAGDGRFEGAVVIFMRHGSVKSLMALGKNGLTCEVW